VAPISEAFRSFYYLIDNNAVNIHNRMDTIVNYELYLIKKHQNDAEKLVLIFALICSITILLASFLIIPFLF
jgi:hypothetical protein